LRMLGYKISERTVSSYMPKNNKPPNQSWPAFIKNHMDTTVAIDFFTVPTLFFKNIYVLLVISHKTREIIHFNTTESPNLFWIKRQLLHAFPGGHKYKYLIRDNDKKFMGDFEQFVWSLNISDRKIQKISPWQNGYCERGIGSIKRELFYRVIPMSERHLRKILKSYAEYYNSDRTHIGLSKETSLGRDVDQNQGKVFSEERVGGLYKRCFRAS